MIKVSIIIPIYNVAEYIEQCLLSVFHQTYSNIEVIIVDDCGNDNSIQLVETFLNNISDNRYRIIHHPNNLGLSAARNSGIKEATGDYIYFIDSDDFITTDCIETFVEVIKQYPDSDVVFGSAVFFPNNWGGFCLNVKSTKIPSYSNNKRWINSAFFQNDFLPVTAWNKLVSKVFITKNNLFFKEGRVPEYQIWYLMMANACTQLAFNKNDTYFYRNNPKGIMHNYGIKEMNSEITIIKECLSHINFSYFLSQFIHIIHLAHIAYCRKFGSSHPIYIRYPKAFIYFIKGIFTKYENLKTQT